MQFLSKGHEHSLIGKIACTLYTSIHLRDLSISIYPFIFFSISLSVSIVLITHKCVSSGLSIEYLEMMGNACLAWTINNHDTAMSWAHHKPSSCDFKLQFVIGRFECCSNQACSYPVLGHISPAPAAAAAPGDDADCQCQAGYKCQLGLITAQNNANSGDKVATKQQ